MHFHILTITKDSYCCAPLNTALNTAPLIKREKQRTLESKYEYYRTNSGVSN